MKIPFRIGVIGGVYQLAFEQYDSLSNLLSIDQPQFSEQTWATHLPYRVGELTNVSRRKLTPSDSKRLNFNCR